MEHGMSGRRAAEREGDRVAITSKRLRGKQRAWAINYERVTGFEPLHQDEYDRGAVTFQQFRDKNLTWLEYHHQEEYELARDGGTR